MEKYEVIEKIGEKIIPFIEEFIKRKYSNLD